MMKVKMRMSEKDKKKIKIKMFKKDVYEKGDSCYI